MLNNAQTATQLSAKPHFTFTLIVIVVRYPLLRDIRRVMHVSVLQNISNFGKYLKLAVVDSKFSLYHYCL